MKCNRCNSNIPDISKVCPYCGKRVDKAEIPNLEDGPEEAAHDIDGVTLSQPGILLDSSEQEIRTAQPAPIEVSDLEEDSDSPLDMLEPSESLESKEPVDAPVSETYNTADDYEPNALDLSGPSEDSASDEELPELMFRPPQESDTGIRRMTDVLPDRENITEDPYQASGQVGPKVEQKNWDAYPDRIAPGQHVPAPSMPNASPVHELSKEITAKKPSNALAGFMAIVLALFMITKGGAWLLNWFQIFDGELYKVFVTPWLERIEIGIMIFVVWIISAIARPVSLKILALLFAFAATVIFGLVVYLRFFS